MKTSIVTASINELSNLRLLINSAADQMTNLFIIDEGDERIRSKNREILKGLPQAYYGPKERREWFRQRFNKSFEKYLEVIPSKCHAETSFGFLLAKEEQSDLIIEFDDDVFPTADSGNIVEDHSDNLLNETGVTVSSRSRWYNTLENLVFDVEQPLFPRGHPYANESREEEYSWSQGGDRSVLNMGHWTGQADLDAVTILYHGGLDGRCDIEGKRLRRDKIVLENGTYFATCSMNCAFDRKIVPAFYQLYMNTMGVDRFDDIWSGIILKKIADHLGDRVSLGKPLVYHNKSPRSTFKNLRSELEGIAINERLWKIIDSANLEGGGYEECYLEIIEQLKKSLDLFGEKLHRDFIEMQTGKMELWLSVMDKLN